MKKFWAALAMITAIGMADTATACETFKTIAASEIKEYRDKLGEADADPIDRLFAYQELACSDQPVVRAYAIRIGLETARDPILRQQIAFDALMQMPRIDVQLSSEGVQGEAKKFLSKNGLVLSYNVVFRDTQKGCLSFNWTNGCDANNVINVKGDTILYNIRGAIGTLTLSETGEYIGSLRYEGSAIPAKIKIY